MPDADIIRGGSSWQSAVLAMIDSVRPSVCLSVTTHNLVSGYRVKTTQATIVGSSL